MPLGGEGGLHRRPDAATAVLDAATYATVEAKVTAARAADGAGERMKPWLVAMTARRAGAAAAPGFDPSFGLDRHFYDRARAAGRPVRGLETAAYQIEWLDGLPMPVQVEMLQADAGRRRDPGGGRWRPSSRRGAPGRWRRSNDCCCRSSASRRRSTSGSWSSATALGAADRALRQRAGAVPRRRGRRAPGRTDSSSWCSGAGFTVDSCDRRSVRPTRPRRGEPAASSGAARVPPPDARRSPRGDRRPAPSPA